MPPPSLAILPVPVPVPVPAPTPDHHLITFLGIRPTFRLPRRSRESPIRRAISQWATRCYLRRRQTPRPSTIADKTGGSAVGREGARRPSKLQVFDGARSIDRGGNPGGGVGSSSTAAKLFYRHPARLFESTHTVRSENSLHFW